MLMCAAQGGLSIYVMFDAQGRQAEVAEMSAISVTIDGMSIRIPADRVVTKTSDANVVVGLEKWDRGSAEDSKNRGNDRSVPPSMRHIPWDWKHGFHRWSENASWLSDSVPLALEFYLANEPIS